jgi:uncharacterized protein
MGRSHRGVAPGLSPRRRIGVFAKAPVPGFAKTRLMPLLGAAGAAALQATLTEQAVHKAVASGARVTLWTAGVRDHSDHPFWAQLMARHGCERAAQQGDDLGARMAHALAAMTADGDAALIIGTDCPVLTVADLDAAFAALTQHDHVFVPAEDGGYVLVGSRRPVPALFAAIDWGTAEVMTQTRARLTAAGETAVCELPMRWDLDTPDDWQRARAEGLID